MGKRFTEYTLGDVLRLKGGFFKTILKNKVQDDEHVSGYLEIINNYFKYIHDSANFQGYDASKVLLSDFPFFKLTTHDNSSRVRSNGAVSSNIMLLSSDLDTGSYRELGSYYLEGCDHIKEFCLNQVSLAVVDYIKREEGSYSLWSDSNVNTILDNLVSTDSIVRRSITPNLYKLMRQANNYGNRMNDLSRNVVRAENRISEYAEKIESLKTDIHYDNITIRELAESISNISSRIDEYMTSDSDDSEYVTIFRDQINRLVADRIAYPVSVYNALAYTKILFKPFNNVTMRNVNPALGVDETYDFGKLGIVLSIPKEGECTVSVVPTDGHFLRTRSGHIHPNVSSGGSLCFGTGADDYRDYVANKDFYNIIAICYSVLRTYSPDNPYVQHHNFRKLSLVRYKSSWMDVFRMSVCADVNDFKTSNILAEESTDEENLNESNN